MNNTNPINGWELPENKEYKQVWVLVGFALEEKSNYFEPIRMTRRVWEAKEGAEEYAKTCAKSWQPTPVQIWIIVDKLVDNGAEIK